MFFKAHRTNSVAWIGVIALMLLTACAPTPTPVALAIPIDPRCTTCDDFIACEPSDAAGAGRVVYHLQPKTFLAQVATIFDYLLQAVWQRAADERPLNIFSDSGVQSAVGRLDLQSHAIGIGDRLIDQRSGAWSSRDGALLGECRLMPLTEGRSFLKERNAGS